MFDIPRCIVTIAFIIGSFLILMPRRTQRLRRSRALLSLADLLEHRGGFPECVIAHRHAAIDRLLQDDLLEVVGGESALDQRRAHVHAEFLPPADRHHGADDKDAARTLLEMGTRPHLAPGAAGDEILPFGGEGGLAGIGLIDPGVAQDLAARIRAALVAFLVVHRFAPRQNNDGPRGRRSRPCPSSEPPASISVIQARRNPSTVFAYASGCSTLE